MKCSNCPHKKREKADNEYWQGLMQTWLRLLSDARVRVADGKYDPKLAQEIEDELDVAKREGMTW